MRERFSLCSNRLFQCLTWLGVAGLLALAPVPAAAQADTLPDPILLAEPNQAILFYNRPDEVYTGWELHIWNNSTCDAYTDAQRAGVVWTAGVLPAGVDPNYGTYWVLDLKDGHSDCGNFIVHQGDDKEHGGDDKKMDLTGDRMNWSLSGVSEIFPSATLEAPGGDDPGTDTPVTQPDAVSVPGNFQEELGCPGDWQPECSTTQLSLDENDEVWQGTFTLPAGDWEYKTAINQSWDENYGANAAPGGANIALSLAEETSVKFFYDHATHWITDDVNAEIITAAGSFQSELGCSGDFQPACLQSWLQDVDGDGIYTLTTTALPAGSYQVKAAHDQSWEESYGAGGVLGGTNISFSVAEDNDTVAFSYDAASHVLSVGDAEAKGNLGLAKAYWLTRDAIAWNVRTDATVQLHHDAEGGLSISLDGIGGGEAIALAYDANGMSDTLKAKWPHLANLPVFKISDSGDLVMVPQILKQQFAVSAMDETGTALDATSVQHAGVLDDLYGDQVNASDDADLGVSFDSDSPTLSLWAPTARAVTLHVFDDSDPATTSIEFAMTEDAATGIWRVTGDASWDRKYYLFEVEVFTRSSGQVENNFVTDPYMISAGVDGFRSQIVNLEDENLKPAGWDALAKPALAAPEDIVVYELHVRDFSMADATVDEALRGKFMAFTQTDSNGMRHLASLADSGLTHIHLLPAFDCASINEDPADRQEVDLEELETYGPDSEQQQAAVAAIKDQDGFNWCYDPFHYTLPEGSYATEPDGATRVLEFRDMVAALSNAGLRVIMDVVYNHTAQSGQGAKSVFDKIVPGYYHRLNAEGSIERSTCCENTASEHAMMEKLMLDSMKTWARYYKVDGFRFDLMGHHSRENLEKTRDMLQALTLAQDGVDGSTVYLYGEGWNFGEVANNARFVQATQANMAGTGIGTFNDRIRDAVRGGGPFSGRQEQGFATGLSYDANESSSGNQQGRLEQITDWIRVSLAGNLASYPIEDRNGNQVVGSGVDYNGSPAGYTVDPQEVINYAAAHDNETLFDAIQYKAPLATSAADRVRMQNMANSLILLGQGIPFIHAGQDMLRSKSMDRDSFNSGDWFNRLDFSYIDNGWGSGLPVAEKNQDAWGDIGPLLANPDLAVDSANIQRAVQHMREMLEVRKSSPLFMLNTAEQVIERLTFHNTGSDQLPGLIVMGLSDEAGSNLDSSARQLVVLFNANDEAQTLRLPEVAGSRFDLHPTLQNSTDSIVSQSGFTTLTAEFRVPGRTTAVFVRGEDDSGDASVLLGEDAFYWDDAILPASGKVVTAPEAQLYRTYSGALGRTPDDGGYDWWLEEIVEGRRDLNQMAADFIWSAEFTGFFGLEAGDPIDNEAFVEHMYRNVFGREPDQAGLDFWLGQLQSGARTQNVVLVEMTQSNEYVELTVDATVDYRDE